MIDFPKIFVINLKRSIERKKSIEKQLNDLNLNFEIFEAVDGNELSDEEIKRYYSGEKAKQIKKRKLTKEEIGCYLSHIKVYEKIVNENLAIALILEDDVNLKNFTCEIIESLISKSEYWDITQLYYSHSCLYYWYKLRLNKKYKLRKFVNIPSGLAAYLINKPAAERILDCSYPIVMPIDDFIYRNKNYLKIRCVHPLCVNHPTIDIDQTTMNERSIIRSERREQRSRLKDFSDYVLVNLSNLIKKFNPVYKIN